MSGRRQDYRAAARNIVCHGYAKVSQLRVILARRLRLILAQLSCHRYATLLLGDTQEINHRRNRGVAVVFGHRSTDGYLDNTGGVQTVHTMLFHHFGHHALELLKTSGGKRLHFARLAFGINESIDRLAYALCLCARDDIDNRFSELHGVLQVDAAPP